MSEFCMNSVMVEFLRSHDRMSPFFLGFNLFMELPMNKCNADEWIQVQPWFLDLASHHGWPRGFQLSGPFHMVLSGYVFCHNPRYREFLLEEVKSYHIIEIDTSWNQTTVSHKQTRRQVQLGPFICPPSRVEQFCLGATLKFFLQFLRFGFLGTENLPWILSSSCKNFGSSVTSKQFFSEGNLR